MAHASPSLVRSSRALVVALLGAAAIVVVGVADAPAAHAASTSLVISEFRVHGPFGGKDEFIEVQNIGAADLTVSATSGTGFAIAASDGGVRCVIPNGTVIPRFGHFLCVNTSSFSIGGYPAGSGTVGLGDAGY